MERKISQFREGSLKRKFGRPPYGQQDDVGDEECRIAYPSFERLDCALGEVLELWRLHSVANSKKHLDMELSCLPWCMPIQNSSISYRN